MAAYDDSSGDDSDFYGKVFSVDDRVGPRRGVVAAQSVASSFSMRLKSHTQAGEPDATQQIS